MQLLPLAALLDPKTRHALQVLGELSSQVADFSAKVDRLMERMGRMSDTLDQEIAQLTSTVERMNTVQQSVTAFVQGVPQLIADAVAKAQQAGATEQQLAALHDLNTKLSTEADAIVQAVVTNTSAEGESSSPAA